MAKQNKLTWVPPYMPLIWQDWMSSADIRSMTMAQRGIYISILLHQWIYDGVPRDAWQLSKDINAKYDTVKRFLQTYPHLFVCRECGGSWTGAVGECCGSSGGVVVENIKLRNLRKEAISDTPLGTNKTKATEVKVIQQQQKQPSQGKRRNDAFSEGRERVVLSVGGVTTRDADAPAPIKEELIAGYTRAELEARRDLHLAAGFGYHFDEVTRDPQCIYREAFIEKTNFMTSPVPKKKKSTEGGSRADSEYRDLTKYSAFDCCDCHTPLPIGDWPHPRCQACIDRCNQEAANETNN
jgi:hypothetical protein